jgi:Ca-activated chloride channel family protein
MIHFEFPWAFALLLLLPFIGWFYLGHQRFVSFPSLSPLLKIPFSWTERSRHIPLGLRLLTFLLLTIALARPQIPADHQDQLSEGLDIVLVIDTSRSMEARDFVIQGARPNRLEVVKKVLFDFISERPSDRIGLVIFGSEAFTQAPLTLDHQVLLKFLEKVRIGMAGDATAIGDGLTTAVNRLKKLDTKSKVVILLTDGANTYGRVDPLVAVEAAVSKKVTVYTIGVGTPQEQNAVDAGQGGSGMDLDEKLLKTIAEKTGGQYFLATNTEALRQVYDTIDQLEKSKAKIKSFRRYEEIYPEILFGVLCLIFLELLFGLSRLRSIP